MAGYESVSETTIASSPEEVWAALTDNDRFGEAMFGTEVVTDWQVGSPIVYQGEFEGKAFRDEGEVVELDAPRRLRLTHRSGDSPLHELRFDLEPAGDGTRITLTQDNNASEEAAQHSQGNWDAMLGLLKKVVEGS
jgi:uncharacterized protein YndB with AHSA1/START domain